VVQEEDSITEALVQALVSDQFPEWSSMPVRAVSRQGWDNRVFLVGDSMLARLPSTKAYEAQVYREQRWLPLLQNHLPLEIPKPLALGRPGHGYTCSWSIYRWIEGDNAASSPPNEDESFAKDLGAFLNALRKAPAAYGPEPGPHNFYRGGSLAVYDTQFRQAVQALSGRVDESTALAAWQTALGARWQSPPVWVHGDIALGNLLVREGSLSAVIDFGQLCVGDPACDLAIAWTHFRGEDRRTFLKTVDLDSGTCERGRAWALWKATIVASGLVQTSAVEGLSSWQTIQQVLDDVRAEA
jgi:aminoglycoside phosphotransferase (APT) family kinase protein